MHARPATTAPRRRTAAVAASLLALVLSLLAAPPASASAVRGTVYSTSNEAAGNRLLVYAQHGDGSLSERDSVATGGTGTDAGLGSQGAVVVHRRVVLAVNAGSDSLSSFALTRKGPVLVDVVDSRGGTPTSVTAFGDTVYVLNTAGGGSISGYHLGSDGTLTAMEDGVRPLSGADTTMAAQIQFTRAGRSLVVTERATNLLTTFSVDRHGSASAPSTTPSAGRTPFGFDVDARGRVFVSEAFGGAPDASAVSSYAPERRSSDLDVIDPSVPTTETAACWVEVTRDGRFLYTTNTGSGTVTGYAIGFDGSLSRLDDDGVTASAPGSGPLDVVESRDTRFLYVLRGGTDVIGGHRIGADGSLAPLGALVDLPPNAAGLASH